jgi:hypothetical protein
VVEPHEQQRLGDDRGVMTATCTVTTVSDPVNALNLTAVTATGTCTALNTVTVTIVDSAGAIVGPVTATVAGTGWSIAATDVTALADGTLIYEATSSDGTASAFAASSAQKQTAAPGYITEQQLRDAIHDPSTTLDSTLMQNAILAASRTVEGATGRHFYQHTAAQYFFPDSFWIVSLDDMDLATTTGLSVHVDTGFAATYAEERVFNTDFICEPLNQSTYGVEGWPFTSLRAINGRTWFLRYTDFQQYTVKVVGTWGWPSIPNPVKVATTIIAAYLYKRPEAFFGTTGMPELGMMRVQQPDVSVLLQPYRKQSTKFLVA